MAQQAAIIISKRERERNPRKEEVEIEEGKYLKYSDLLLKKARLIGTRPNRN